MDLADLYFSAWSFRVASFTDFLNFKIDFGGLLKASHGWCKGGGGGGDCGGV